MQGHSVSINGHHVEAEVGIRSDDLHEIGCEPAKRVPFGGVYAGEGAAEAAARTELDFHEDDCIAVTADQVDLASRQAHIAPDDPVAGLLQKCGGAIFPGAAFAAVTPRDHR